MTGKLLFIRYKNSDGIKEGGEQLTNINLSYVRNIFSDSKIEEYAIHNSSKRKLWDKCFGIFSFFRGMFYGVTTQKLKELLAAAQSYEIVYIDRSIFGIISKWLKKNGYKGEIITFFHNFEPVYFKDKISRFNPVKSIIIKCVKQNERWACQYSDTIISLNQRDSQLIQKEYQRAADFLIPISFKDTYAPTEVQKQRTFENPLLGLFIGTNFPANTEGLLWFIKEVMPHVDLRLQIVGKGMEKIKQKLPNDSSIELFGTVPELTPFLENADIMISPIFKGSGMKVKTCEMLMYGKNIIGSSEAFEGYDVDFEKVGALANTKEEFISAIQNFSQKFSYKYNAYSRAFFLENHSDVVIKGRFEEVLFVRSGSELTH